jgi:hypothetical protein
MIKIDKFHIDRFDNELMSGTFVISFFNKIGLSVSIYDDGTAIWIQYSPRNIAYCISIRHSIKDK